MKQQSLSLAAFLIVVAGILSSCVDVPSGGHQPPDYRSSVRFIHAGQGIDTIAMFLGSATGALTPETTYVFGPETLMVRSYRVYSNASYQRVQVDFSQVMELLIDGTSRGSLGFGQSLGYMDAASGGRALKLRGTGVRVDTLYTRDTVVTTIRDTVGRGSSAPEVVTNRNNILAADAGSIVAVLDSTEVALNMPTQTKATIFLTTGVTTITNQRDGLIRYGRMLYLYSTERNTFMPSGLPDTLLVRFMNSSRVAGSVQVRIGIAPQVLNLGVPGIAAYLPYQSAAGTSYTFLFSRTATPSVPFDSVTIASTASARVTSVLMDSANTVVVKTYLDE